MLAKDAVLSAEQASRLKERYPTTAWDFMSLVRAFTILGAATAIAGMVVLVREHLNWWLVSDGRDGADVAGSITRTHAISWEPDRAGRAGFSRGSCPRTGGSRNPWPHR